MSRVYSALKPSRFLDRLEPGPVKAPVHVRIKPVNACNHNCWYCAYRVDNLQLGSGMDERDRLPPAKFDELVSDLVSMGVKAVTFAKQRGGAAVLDWTAATNSKPSAAGSLRKGDR